MKVELEISDSEPEFNLENVSAQPTGPRALPDLTHWSRSRALNIRKQITKLQKNAEGLKGAEKRAVTVKINALLSELEPLGGLDHLPGDPWPDAWERHNMRREEAQ